MVEREAGCASGGGIEAVEVIGPHTIAGAGDRAASDLRGGVGVPDLVPIGDLSDTRGNGDDVVRWVRHDAAANGRQHDPIPAARSSFVNCLNGIGADREAAGAAVYLIIKYSALGGRDDVV